MRPRRHASILFTLARFAWAGFALLALLTMSCASADKLARQSDQMLARGDLRGAYEKARRELDKDAGNVNARNAYAAAATELSDDFKGRVLRLAAADTIAAARTALDFRDLRAEIARYPVEVTPEVSYLTQEDRILTGAARQRYREGDEALALAHPKEAWRHFTEAMGFDPGYRDVENRVAQAYAQALTRVAVVPFENQVEVPGLAQSLQQTLATEMSRRSASPAFRFTRVLSPADVDDRMTVSQSRGLTRDQARSLGRTLGADRVVCGRITGLRSDSDLADWRFPVYHSESGKDPDGNPVERWVESMLHVISRTRHVQVTCSYEVVDVKSGEVLAADSQPYESWARVVWSDFAASGDCDRYRLSPPEASSTESDRAQKDWDEHMRGMPLPQVLEKARASDRRERWDSRYRPEFPRDSREHPVFLAQLPPEHDMAFLALQAAWQPVLDALRSLDPQD